MARGFGTDCRVIDLGRSVKLHERAISLTDERTKTHGDLKSRNKNKTIDDIYTIIECSGLLIKPSFPQPSLEHHSRGIMTARNIAFAMAAML